MGRVINLLNSPIIGKKSSFAFVSLLTGLGISIPYVALGDYQRAKELLERALPIIEKHYGEDHFEVARALVNLSIACGALGDAQRVEELIERALPILEKHYGGDHFEVAEILVNLGNAYRALDNYQRVKELLERALPIIEYWQG